MTLDKYKQSVELRWYQTEAIDALFSYFYTHGAGAGNPLVALPTGSGKSVVQAMFVQRIMQHWPNQRMLCLTHVKELVKNNFVQMQRIWLHAPIGIYAAGLKQRDLHYPITFGSMQSVVKVIEAFGHIDLLIVDEAHLMGGNDDGVYNRIIAILRKHNPRLKVIGFTATVWRTGMGLLTNGPVFTDICYNICNIVGFRRLFDDGHLVPPYARKTRNEYDVSGIATIGDDYAQGKLNAVTRNEKVTWAALNESLALGQDRGCRLVFCTGIEHAVMCADMLQHLGLKARAVHSGMPDKERDIIMSQFFSGEIDTLTNNGICTTGIDHPPIDHIIMLRPTKSVGLWVQMLGRGTRPYEFEGWRKLDCLVTDHGGNAARLGTIDDPYIPKQKGKGAPGDMPVKLCPACGTYNHAAATECDKCGEPFVTRIGYREKAYDDQLVRSDLPVKEKFIVDWVSYTRYLRQNALPDDKPTLKASYACGSKRFSEYIAFEGHGFALKRARDWWRQRFPEEGFIPATVEDAARHIDKLVKPKCIEVWTNRKYPEVLGYEF